MLKGDVLAEFYVSYRHPTWKRSAYFAVFQHSETSAVRYKVKPHDNDEVIVDTSEEATRLFQLALETANE